MPIDILSAKIVEALITKLSVEAASSIKSPASKIYDNLKVKFRIGFPKYIEQQIQRYSFVKTLISNQTPIDILDLYVNLQLRSGHKTVRDEDILRLSEKFRRFIFTATAGSGKSMLMRYLYLMFLREQQDVVPIFFELREVNDTPSVSILECIKTKISDHVQDFTQDQLNYAMEKGAFALFLDGYDEIDHDKRRSRASEINNITAKYPNATVFVSSRPDESFSGWERFHVYHLEHFTESQVRQLIGKIPYDTDAKSVFLKKLDTGLYKTHREFLVNPLLTIMMLITLEQFAEVPGKIHLFYEYAFEALFARHDVTKGGFKRKRHVDIALDDYRRLFAYFCMITYMRKLFSFSESTALEALEKSISSSQVSAKKEDLLLDLSQCTCMLVRDGLDFAFSHRSFQEYFAAYFISRIKVDDFERAAEKIISRGPFDNVFLMISEMNMEKFEESWALPKLNELFNIIVDIDAKNYPISYVAKMHGKSRIGVHERSNDELSIEIIIDGEPNPVRQALFQVYGLFEKINKLVGSDYSTDMSIVKRIRTHQFLEKDKRFDKLRAESGQFDIGRTKISDNSWMKTTRVGRFIACERDEVIKLKNDVARRVQHRKDGLNSIFDLGS